ncbi:tetratricopeptide repeat protein, partial [Alphaproteobacteria bacterium]|nr:tetratricopeptide repeat protein [Alphaproteobacteria bacterium]
FHNNLGNLLKNSFQLEKAEVCYREAIKLEPTDPEANNNLGVTLQELDRLEESEEKLKKAITLKPDFPSLYNNLANTVKSRQRLEEAVRSYNKAINLDPDFVEAHNNLGVTLDALGKLEAAISSYRTTITLDPIFSGVHNNLGLTFYKQDRLDAAVKWYKKAILLKPQTAQAFGGLGRIFYSSFDMSHSLSSFKKAYNIDPNNRLNELLSKIIKGRILKDEKRTVSHPLTHQKPPIGFGNEPIILDRPVETGLIKALYKVNTQRLDDTPDTRFGNGSCSGYNLFSNSSKIIQSTGSDLLKILKTVLKGDIHIEDSFFNIYRSGAGITSHDHLSDIDKDKYLNLSLQKYSLVYYLDIGDQKSDQPGVLKLFDPLNEILPSAGMIVIFPARRQHSAVYSGTRDRVMIGINFYLI